ncbi:MAG: hypothetical protein Q7J60_09680 [Bradyrhizobium sp.]|uniref:hypothetical protein n=1 Tax=Bradyrhizobium sp. TaxID=376 RepID=UPI0027170D54|nr:hypothetical protein [Bradyrhizobium sp.]MDO9561879.1 hypothetical protein [Bradyrhizobium sp.]MDP3693947.1 hypothetical protein [Bradyrhizobium sp.]
MRKLILITAMVLASATAQAGPTRSLTLASNDQLTGAEQARPVEQQAVEAPKAVQTPAAGEAPVYVARPAAIGTATEASKPETTKPVVGKATRMGSAEKPKRRRESTEARVIRELNRHGIYW